MKFIIYLSLVLTISFNHTIYGENPEEIKEVSLSTCTDKKLGVQFFCNSEWDLETDQDAILVIISEDPAVTFTVARTKSPVILIEQLSRQTLKEMGQYADDFSFKILKVDGKEGVEVNAVAEDFPEIILRDFYVLHGSDLYSLLFSVNPQENFEQFQPIFNKIIESVQFIQETNASQEQAKPESAEEIKIK